MFLPYVMGFVVGAREISLDLDLEGLGELDRTLEKRGVRRTMEMRVRVLSPPFVFCVLLLT